MRDGAVVRAGEGGPSIATMSGNITLRVSLRNAAAFEPKNPPLPTPTTSGHWMAGADEELWMIAVDRDEGVGALGVSRLHGFDEIPFVFLLDQQRRPRRPSPS